MSGKIMVIGSANVDIVIHSEKMPELGETLVGSNFQVNAGGKGLNQAIAIARLGGDVSFLGAMGEDSNGDFLLNVLKEHKISFQGIKSENLSTGIAMITVVDGDNFIILHEGANKSLTPEIIEQYSSKISESDFVVLQLEIPVETVLKVCEISKKNGTKVVLNPAPFKELPEEIYSLVDYLIPNEHEARMLTGISIDNRESAIKAVQKLKSLGVKHCIITLGEQGCVYNDGDKILFCPARKTKVIDTTSAGDCFIGALVSGLRQHLPLSQSIDFATKAAAITVSREGASKSIPFSHEIQ